ncbi:alkyl/aryl-sulfatase [Lactiplantibacillus plantarum]|nr:alkyl/aryl-sulfatase [Lactiplantibacillus plantarum]
MLIDNGAEALRQFSKVQHKFQVFSPNPNLIHVVGLGHSNAGAIVGNRSVILIDTLDSVARAEILKQIIEEKFHKPVETIIYTHGHPDHRGGAGVFKDTVKEIIAFKTQKPVLKYYERIRHASYKRADYQFGYHLNDTELISMGIGKREKGTAIGEGDTEFLAPTTVYDTKGTVERVIDGVHLKLVSAVGESDDEIFIWDSRDQAMFCGDNYYACWPNLYALRGTQYRDVASWIDSLDMIRKYPAKYLLPGHTQVVQGTGEIATVLKNYRDAISWVLFETLHCIDMGLSISQTVEKVKLPDRFSNLPYLGEYYGTVAWSVRSIFTGYVGWFDGNATNLNRLPDSVFNKKLLDLISHDKLEAAIQTELSQHNFQLAAELCDIILKTDEKNKQVQQWQALAFKHLADEETAASGRHYYINCAKKLEKILKD